MTLFQPLSLIAFRLRYNFSLRQSTHCNCKMPFSTRSKISMIFYIHCTQFFSLVLGTALIAMVATFWMLFVVLPLIGIFIYARHYYIKTAKQIKQLEVSGNKFQLLRFPDPLPALTLGCLPTARVPVYQHVSSTLSGLWTIRAFLGEDQYLRNFDAHQDRHTAAGYLQLAAVRWFTLRLDALSIIFVVLLAFILVATRWSESTFLVAPLVFRSLKLKADIHNALPSRCGWRCGWTGFGIWTQSNGTVPIFSATVDRAPSTGRTQKCSCKSIPVGECILNIQLPTCRFQACRMFLPWRRSNLRQTLWQWIDQLWIGLSME